ncbi:RhoGEF domain-containing protein [Rhizoctonia solani AG-1 IA]|uniref:RhoGEF domain-containing protein n=1 Tax=Thanatephorus cucumeris (strain AG1-IA) TaxID=983506 RepID=L8X4G8_THACA|nr:RhoGEF domain-containing protein [Rhizoctonia solani AG-1 IA]
MQSHILRGYAKYVLHLERALEQVDNALAAANVTKRPRNQDAAQWTQVCKALQVRHTYCFFWSKSLFGHLPRLAEHHMGSSFIAPLRVVFLLRGHVLVLYSARGHSARRRLSLSPICPRLEEVAADKCETGLAISLSKPFQRLLKYPLLFQNLLFQTDPSTYEYESTLEMVAEVERIVRSIEDEKTQKEERDRTWDVFARIEGMDKVKVRVCPSFWIRHRTKGGGDLRPLHPDPTAPDVNRTVSGPPTTTPNKNVRGKNSFRRLSDVLQPGSSGLGGKKDFWLVSFNDVVLRCQRTGVTTMPLVSGGSRDKLPAANGSSKSATVGRRATQVKPRNLYKFIKIETWAIEDVTKPRAGIVSMEDPHTRGRGRRGRRGRIGRIGPKI